MSETMEIMITSLNDLKELDNFIAETNSKVEEVKELVVVDEPDIKLVNADVKDLKAREDTLKSAEQKLIHLAGIDRIGKAIKNSSKQRLIINRRVEDAKQKIRDDAVKLFVTKANEAVSKSKAHISFKTQFNLTQIATDAIKGKSRDLQGIVENELKILQIKLDGNALETQEKLKVIKKYSNDLVRDVDNLMNLSVGDLVRELDARQVAKDNEIKEAEERARVAEAERLEGDRLEAEKAQANQSETMSHGLNDTKKPAGATAEDWENIHAHGDSVGWRVLHVGTVFENFIKDPSFNAERDKVVFGQYSIYLNGEITTTKTEIDADKLACVSSIKDFLMAIKNKEQ